MDGCAVGFIGMSGTVVSEGAKPVIRNYAIKAGLQGEIRMYQYQFAVFECCRIDKNAFLGIDTSKTCNAVLRGGAITGAPVYVVRCP